MATISRYKTEQYVTKIFKEYLGALKEAKRNKKKLLPEANILFEGMDEFAGFINSNNLQQKVYNRLNLEGIKELFNEAKLLALYYDLPSFTSVKDCQIDTDTPNDFQGWIVRLSSNGQVESIEYKNGNDVLEIFPDGKEEYHKYPGNGSRAGFLARYAGLPVLADGTSPETEKLLSIAGYKYSSHTNKWEKGKNALAIFSIYGTKLPKGNITLTYFRNPKSYSPSFDRDDPVNEYLDYLIMTNSKLGETVVIKEIQTVANYPLTTPTNESHPNSFKDTVAAGKVQFKYKTSSSAVPGDCLVIINSKTLDGRKIDTKGFTEKAITEGRGLVHSSENPATGKPYEHAYSEQCFICKNIEDHKLLMQTLLYWGCEDGDIIKGEVVVLKDWECL